ncbi:MAG: vWA domain-containing protein [Bacteroidota bacterium]
MKRGIAAIIFSFVFSWGNSFAQEEEGLTRILFIFDASNSMNAPWQGSNRIEIARKIMQQSVDSLRNIENLEIALRIYGHQTPLLPGQQDCNDTKLEVPFGPNNWDQVKSWIKYVVPKGTTPIARSLEKAGGDFPECKSCRNIIVLVTDGIEACDEDPCAIAKALRSKNIIVKPFVIGVGLNADYLKALECIGTVYDAANEEMFKNALNTVVSQALNNTTAQINLLDVYKKPTETNVSFTLYDQRTNAIRHNYVHTMNKWNNPDTLQLDPLITYRLVVHTIPQVEKKNIKITPGKHNIIEVDAPQGFLDLKIANAGKMAPDVKCIVRKQNEMNTLTVQGFTESQKYIVGKYDLEILTLPRIYMEDVEIKQSYHTKIEIPLAGILDLNTSMTGYGAIFTVGDNGEMKWVCNIKEDSRKQFISLQPGKYKIVYRNKKTDKTIYSYEKSFLITSNQTTVLSL